MFNFIKYKKLTAATAPLTLLYGDGWEEGCRKKESWRCGFFLHLLTSSIPECALLLRMSQESDSSRRTATKEAECRRGRGGISTKDCFWKRFTWFDKIGQTTSWPGSTGLNFSPLLNVGEPRTYRLRTKPLGIVGQIGSEHKSQVWSTKIANHFAISDHCMLWSVASSKSAATCKYDRLSNPVRLTGKRKPVQWQKHATISSQVTPTVSGSVAVVGQWISRNHSSKRPESVIPHAPHFVLLKDITGGFHRSTTTQLQNSCIKFFLTTTVGGDCSATSNVAESCKRHLDNSKCIS